MKEINQRIGQKIKEAREERGITQKELGEFLGYSPMGISYFEKGEREMRLSDIQRVATFFGKEPSHFLSAGFTIFRAEKTVDLSVSKSVDDFNNFLNSRRHPNAQ